jgi:hypothetical protein
MPLSEENILQLKALHSFLKTSFRGSCIGPLKIDDCADSLDLVIATECSKEKITGLSANRIYDKAYAHGLIEGRRERQIMVDMLLSELIQFVGYIESIHDYSDDDESERSLIVSGKEAIIKAGGAL